MRIKTEVKRCEILDAAAVEFRQRGYHETTISHVAARMGSSKATIYNYFRSKGELFGSVLARFALPATEALLETLKGPSPLPDGLFAFARAYLRMQCSEEAITIQRLVLVENAEARAIRRVLFNNPDISIWPHLARILQEAQGKGALQCGNCDEMARHLGALLYGDMPTRLLFGERDSLTNGEIDASADSAVRMFFAAYGSR
jgi:TetR/AcrR family transcriptional regulator, mexJK operon transcriptional repressor